MTITSPRMKQLLISITCALTFGSMSSTANANMCMKKPYGHHAYMKPLPAHGMYRHPGPTPAYRYPAYHHENYASRQAPVHSAEEGAQPQKTGAESKTFTLPTYGPDIVEIAAAAGEFDTLIKAVVAADLYDTLRSDGPFTVFAPTDAAFAKLPEGTLDGLISDKEKLANVLTYHVVAGRVTAADILQERELMTVQGETLSTNKLSVIKADVETANGIIHIVDSVLIPGS
jgi:uncharacterized surface protein with fasciclin (FAS1) repeats